MTVNRSKLKSDRDRGVVGAAVNMLDAVFHYHDKYHIGNRKADNIVVNDLLDIFEAMGISCDMLKEFDSAAGCTLYLRLLEREKKRLRKYIAKFS